jgi:hypothetical protein
MKILYLSFTFLLILLISACGTDTSSGSKSTETGTDNISPPDNVSISVINNPDSANPQPADTSILQPSRLTVSITDAPLVNIAKVVVSFLSIEFIRENPSQSVKFTFDTPKQIDLLTLQGSTSETLFSEVDIEAGSYKELRVVIDDSDMSSYVELYDGSVHTLTMPGSYTSGLKVKGDFDFEEGKTSAYTIDFDLAKSLIMDRLSGNYHLKPVLRIVETSKVGHFRETVDPTLLTSSNCSDSDINTYNAVYIYRGYDVIPSDINFSTGFDDQLITTTLIRFDYFSGDYIFEAAYLPPGEYTIAFTCNADLEDPGTDNDLRFFNAHNVNVQINNILFL